MFRKTGDLPFPNDASALFLPWMVLLMVFFASLSTAGVLSLNSMLSRWSRSISGSLTVQVLPFEENGKIDRKRTQAETENVLDILRQTPGIAAANVLTERQLTDLLKPWLGDTVLLEDLPMPRLIDVRLMDDASVDLNALKQKLTKKAPNASLDVHKLWLGKMMRLMRAIKLLGTTVLSLVIATTSFVVVYVTGSSFAVHRPIVELLHQMGAHDSYISKQYARRVLFLSVLGALFGTGAAVPVLLTVASLIRGFEGGLLSEARFGVSDWFIIGAIPVFAVMMTTTTAYETVKRTLKRLP